MLQNCTKCRRLAAGLKALRKTHPDWYNKPVPAAGPQEAPLLIVGLAPGKAGANRTGVPFLGDASSKWLRQRLIDAGLLDDGLGFIDVRITNAVKCLPPGNRPTGPEIRTCSTAWLAPELQVPSLRAILCLGGVAHRAVNSVLNIPQKSHPFAHGAQYSHGSMALFSSFHPSPLNTQTGRLSPDQFQQVLSAAAAASKGIVHGPPAR
jgi:uracil-DNA glycosylase family 4